MIFVIFNHRRVSLNNTLVIPIQMAAGFVLKQTLSGCLKE